MTIRTCPVPHGGGRATAAAPDRSRADAVLAAVAIVLLMQVWRVQELFPILAVPGLPIVATLGAGLLFFLGRNSGRALGGLDRPLVAAVLGILVLDALSIPGSLYPRYSFEFLLKDYLRTVVLMLLVAASVRGLADLRRLVWLQVVGVTLFSAVMLTRGSVASDGRLSETAYYDVNDLATLIVCSLPLALHRWRWAAAAISSACRRCCIRTPTITGAAIPRRAAWRFGSEASATCSTVRSSASVLKPSASPRGPSRPKRPAWRSMAKGSSGPRPTTPSSRSGLKSGSSGCSCSWACSLAPFGSWRGCGVGRCKKGRCWRVP